VAPSENITPIAYAQNMLYWLYRHRKYYIDCICTENTISILYAQNILIDCIGIENIIPIAYAQNMLYWLYRHIKYYIDCICTGNTTLIAYAQWIVSKPHRLHCGYEHHMKDCITLGHPGWANRVSQLLQTLAKINRACVSIHCIKNDQVELPWLHSHVRIVLVFQLHAESIYTSAQKSYNDFIRIKKCIQLHRV